MLHFVKRYLLPLSGCFRAYRNGKGGADRAHEHSLSCRACWAAGAIAAWRATLGKKLLNKPKEN